MSDDNLHQQQGMKSYASDPSNRKLRQGIWFIANQRALGSMRDSYNFKKGRAKEKDT